MPQAQLPFFPEGVTHSTPLLAFRKEDGRVTYFNGSMPMFVHEEDDVASFCMITAQFCVNGNAKQADIGRAFGVSKISLKLAVKRYREQGPKPRWPTACASTSPGPTRRVGCSMPCTPPKPICRPTPMRGP
jgi:hypothetical protein